MLDTFLWLPVTTLDRLDYRVADIQAVCADGVAALTTQQGDATRLLFDDNSYQVVTMLEVLEHFPAAEQALAEVCRVAQRFVLLSMLSKPDNNLEHIHLFSAATLKPLLRAAAATRVTFDYVPDHIIAIAKVGPA
ncbi:MAG: methyltransferase domain-containing protein [Chloroflexales bacterium]|nr:methyltransferase domain-containing protein [Chloroflexales bacterium]